MQKDKKFSSKTHGKYSLELDYATIRKILYPTSPKYVTKPTHLQIIYTQGIWHYNWRHMFYPMYFQNNKIDSTNPTHSSTTVLAGNSAGNYFVTMAFNYKMHHNCPNFKNAVFSRWPNFILYITITHVSSSWLWRKLQAYWFILRRPVNIKLGMIIVQLKTTGKVFSSYDVIDTEI